MAKTPIRAIRRLSVTGLFGMYDYTVEVTPGTTQADKVFILYGDNGSGKTTLLKTAFHLLAPDDKAGHKSAVAPVEFERFEIELHDGTRVWAARARDKPTGTFSMGIKAPKRKERTIEFIADGENNVKAVSETQNEQMLAFLAGLGELDISLYLLSDDRTIQLAGRRREPTSPHEIEIGGEWMLFEDDPRVMRHRSQIKPEILAHRLLAQAISRAEYWLRRKAIQGSSMGESNVNALYNEILHRLVVSDNKTTIDPTATKQSIEKRVSRIVTQCQAFAQYGLLPSFTGKEIVKAVASAPQTQLGVITNVLNPYLESLERKLAALEPIHSRVDSFVTIVNGFLTNKELRFNLQDGLTINTGRKQLTPAMLSSGERHLMLLFCSTLVAADRPSILMIDEPEISLNIKWQRKLLTSLLECIGENQVQYVFATHSMEILAQHRDKVCKLESTRKSDA